MTTPIDLQNQLTGEQRDAYAALTNLFNRYGLSTLAPKIFDYLKNGFSADTISILLQDTPEYKQRFAGNEIRRQKGLPVLSPAEYLSTEASYRQLMRQSGLPEGFYDQPSDFTSYIGKDVSPTELKSRVDLATQASVLARPEMFQALKTMYGLDQGTIAAYIIDPERALPYVQKQVAAAQIGAEALRQGLQVSGKAEDYAVAGVSQTQANQAYGQIAQQLPDFMAIGHEYGQDVNQATFEESLLGGKGAQTAQLQRLASWNRARATGEAGAGRTGLARSTSGRI